MVSGGTSNDGDAEHYLILGNTRSIIDNGVSYYYRFDSRGNDHAAHGRYRGVAIAYPVCEWEGRDAVPARDGATSAASNDSAKRRGKELVDKGMKTCSVPNATTWVRWRANASHAPLGGPRGLLRWVSPPIPPLRHRCASGKSAPSHTGVRILKFGPIS